MNLPQFWRRFATVHGDHRIFSSGLPLRRVIPFASHGDEGRTKKKQPFLVWSFRGLVGSGTRCCRTRPLEEQADRMPLNMDCSMRSRFLHVAVPNRLYQENENVWQGIAGRVGQAYHELETVGFDYQGERWYATCVALTGDSPFLAKAACLVRSFSRVPKKTGATEPKMVCFRCLAGKRGYPMEDLNLAPSWLKTDLTPELPWKSTPPFLLSLGDPSPQVLQFDAWLDVLEFFSLVMSYNFQFVPSLNLGCRLPLSYFRILTLS